MKKLKKKIFLTLWTILSIFLITTLLIYNFQTFKKEYNLLNDTLNRIENANNLFFPIITEDYKNTNNKPLFIDTLVYVVIYDINYNPINIIGYTENIDEEEVLKLANNYILNYLKNNNYKSSYTLSLYLDKYIYYLNNYKLVIIDNSEMNQRLLQSLDTTLIIFLALEIIIIYTSLKLTTWLTSPIEKAFESQKQFIYDASHELKTPLSVIMASLEMYEDNLDEKKWLNNIKTESNRMNKLIKNLLTLAKLEDAPTKKEYKYNNLSKITNMIVLSFESLIYEKGLKIKTNITKNINLLCDSEEIKQLIEILLNNAIKHSYDKSKIALNLNQNKNLITLEVINRGDPIPKEDYEKIFDRFYRSDKSRNRDENRYGLGLSIAKKIVNNHHGKITVSSKDGYTTFKVNFYQE